MSALRQWSVEIPPEPMDVEEVTIHRDGTGMRRFRRDMSLGGNPRLWHEVGGFGSSRKLWHDLLLYGTVREVPQASGELPRARPQ
jgi:hypothetical protein